MLDNKQEKTKEEYRVVFVRRFYVFLIFLSIITMLIAAYITYGNDAEQIHILLGEIVTNEEIKDSSSQKSNIISVTPDMTNLPSDKEIEKILNDVLPDTCDDCDEDPLECLKEYEINKILIQNPPYHNQLKIELVTGKHEKTIFTVIIDLTQNNQVIYAEGKVDKKRCRDVEEEDEATGEEVMLNPGIDPNQTEYIHTQPLKD